MEKSKKIFCVLSVFLLTLYSCSTDQDDRIKLVKKIVATSADGSAATTLFTYNGDEIRSIDGVFQHTDFTYTDGLISKTATLDKTNQFLETIEYTYVAGELARATSSDNYAIHYIRNADATVSYEKIALNSGNQEVKIYHGILYFQNENFIRDERIMDDSAPGVVSKYTISFDYDSKHNPLYNILGYKKLLGYNEAISSNNRLITTVMTSVSKNDQTISSAKFYKAAFTYDLENYPTQQVEENAISDDGNSGYLKSQYFY